MSLRFSPLLAICRQHANVNPYLHQDVRGATREIQTFRTTWTVIVERNKQYHTSTICIWNVLQRPPYQRLSCQHNTLAGDGIFIRFGTMGCALVIRAFLRENSGALAIHLFFFSAVYQLKVLLYHEGIFYTDEMCFHS